MNSGEREIITGEGKGRILALAPGLSLLRRYDPAWLRHDLTAGISVAAVAIPVAIAYSQLAGLPPVYGLYASILPLVAYAVFGTSHQLIMAPDAATCAIVAAVVTPLAGGDVSRYVALSAALAMIAGVFCIAAGLLRLGFLTNFLARPILAGYLNGIAISIITSQIGKLFGFSLQPAGFFRTIAKFASRAGETHWPTLAVGVSVFAILTVVKRKTPRVPAPLIGVLAGMAATHALGLGDRGVALLGSIPAGLPKPLVPHIGLSDLEPLALGAVGLALISFNSAMVTARGFAVKNRYEIDANQEFIALGAADIGAGLLQGFAVSGADSRTAVNDAAGGKSQLTGLVAAALIIAVLLFVTSPLASLPIAALSAVLVSSALGLFDLKGPLRLRQLSPKEFRLSVITLLGVITVGVLPGVMVAVGVAILQLVARASRPNDAVLGRLPGGEGYRDIAAYPQAETFPGLVIFRFDSALVFFNSDRFKARIRAVVEDARPDVRLLVLDAGTMPGLDSTGAAVLGEVNSELADGGVALWVAGTRGQLREMLERSGLSQQIGPDRFYPTVDAAVESFVGEAV